MVLLLSDKGGRRRARRRAQEAKRNVEGRISE